MEIKINQIIRSPFFVITLSLFPQTMKEIALIGGLSTETAEAAATKKMKSL